MPYGKGSKRAGTKSGGGPRKPFKMMGGIMGRAVQKSVASGSGLRDTPRTAGSRKRKRRARIKAAKGRLRS